MRHRSLIDDLLRENKTTGSNQSEGMLNYTKMNVQRMNRIDKHWGLEQATLDLFQTVHKPMLWQPYRGVVRRRSTKSTIIQKMAEVSEHIQLRMLLRDEHPALIDQFLTNGTRSIQKLIVVNPKTLEVIASWGPRPEPALHG